MQVIAEKILGIDVTQILIHETMLFLSLKLTLRKRNDKGN